VKNVPLSPLNNVWDGDFTRVPYAVYDDRDIYEQEQKTIFKGPVWNFVGLECEIPSPGDYATNWVGETPVIMLRDEKGEIAVLVNRCSHKGSMICYKPQGKTGRLLTCPYHNWTFRLDGTLNGIAFQRGVAGKGGMPEDFDMTRHNLTRLRVETISGAVFATFHPETRPLADYLGPRHVGQIRRIFRDGKDMVLLGKCVQSMDCNWKLYIENSRDTYHPSLLHSFATRFRINRLTMEGGLIQDDAGYHHTMWSKQQGEAEDGSYDAGKLRTTSTEVAGLADPNITRGWREFEDGITAMILSLFPNTGIQQGQNSLAFRHTIPRGPGKCDLVWRFVGFTDDTEEQRLTRIRQSNMFGPGGLISYEDGAVGEWIQKNVAGDREADTVMEMGGREVGSSPSRVTETSVRGFWRTYRDLMSA